MKTTIDIADDLASTLKQKAARDGISMRAAVHEALRLWLRDQPAFMHPKPIPRDIGIMSGQGLTPEAASISWDELRALSYSQKV